jgi:hypothetical protein
MVRKSLAWIALGLAALWSAAAAAQVKEIPWGTSAVGSSGHRSLVTLADLLNKEMPAYRVTVQPTPGAIISVKGYATGQFDGYYGSDIAFYELANDVSRFKGFKAHMKRQPVQSMWIFTTEVGVAIHARDRDKIKKWADLSGKRVFTGPLPWDVRAHLERAFQTLGVKHEYQEVDLSTVGSLLDSGNLTGFIIYANAEAATAPWITELSIGTDWAALNPSAEEVAKLKAAGFPTVEVSPQVFRKDVHADKVVLLPFYYGYHVGMEMPEADVHKMLTLVEAKAADLAKTDPSYEQVRKDMKGMQRRGVESAVEFVPVHPGLARYMRERGVWDAKWDARIAQPK